MNNRIKEITGVGILASLVIVLQLISNYVTFGQISITLSLIPIVIGAILYGKNAGALLGAINGIIVILPCQILIIGTLILMFLISRDRIFILL